MTDAEREEALAKLVQRTTPLTDEEIALLREVWPIIVRAHFSAARRQVKRRLRNDAAVDDILQNTFLDLLRALPGGFPKKGLPALVRTIAARRCLNWLRDNAHERMSVPLPSSGSEKPRSSAPGTEAIVERRELLEVGEQLRSMLSEDHQEVFDLAILGDLSSGEAAELLDMPEGTYKSRVIAMRRAVKVAWEQLTLARRR
jgi:RNA polymerase sigma-70 factor (ECF subfamily)